MTTVQSFDELGLIAPLMQAISEAGYTVPTPIQGMAIQPILEGKDLLGIAQTGTGKTAAFALPIMQRLAADRKPAPRRGCRVLILSPTRELSTQIGETFRALGKHLGITVAVVFGGVAHRPQIQALAQGVDVLVATPGRLLDHIAERNAVLGGTEVFVLDEADQMLDLGFFKPIRRIVAQLPTKRQSLFFSATMPGEIEALTKELLVDPVKVAVTPAATTVELIDQRVIQVESNRKRALLVELLADAAMSRTLIFTRTKRGADRVAKHLDGAGVTVAAIHGNKSQRQREDALEAFRDGNIRVMVATDIAARGIDIDKVSHVVNYELPEVPEAYVHRIGRTARAGASGIAISLVAGDERHLLRDIERVTRQKIASEDRRSDQSLEADTQAAGSAEGREERGRRHGRGQDRPERGRRDGGRSGGRDRPRFERRDRGEQRPVEAGAAAASERPEHRGGDRQRCHGDRRPREDRPHQGRPFRGQEDRPRGEGRGPGNGEGRREFRGEGRRPEGGRGGDRGERRPRFAGDQRREGQGGPGRDRGREHRPERSGEDRRPRAAAQGGQSYWDTGVIDRNARPSGPRGDDRRGQGQNGHRPHGPRADGQHPHGQRAHGQRPHGERHEGRRHEGGGDKPRGSANGSREGRPFHGRKPEGNGHEHKGRGEHRGREGGGRPFRPREGGGHRDRKPAREA